MDKLPDFAGTSIPGIFMGYHMVSGGRWSKDYLMAPLSDFRGGPDAHVRLCRANEIVIDPNQPFIFPLRAAKDKRERELDLLPRENIPISEGPLTEGTNEIEEPPPLGNVTPVPAPSAPGTPENLFDDTHDTCDEAEPEAIPGPHASVADLPSQNTNKKKQNKFHNVAPKVSDVRPDDPNWETGRPSVTTASLGATKEHPGHMASGQRS
eukprot:13657838-Heterocapsa_arctica.AAC.1